MRDILKKLQEGKISVEKCSNSPTGIASNVFERYGI